LNESKGTRYQRLRRRAQLVSVATGASLLLIVAMTPSARALATFAETSSLGFPVVLQPAIALAIFVGALVLAAELVALPMALYAAEQAGKRPSQSRPSASAVLASQARDAVGVIVMALAAAAAVRVSIFLAGPWWWAVASLCLAGTTLAALKLVSAGLRGSGASLPLARPALSAALADLTARTCGRPVAVRVWASSETAGATATVTGVGNGGQVFLSTDMIRDWADDEIVVVVAHELSHHAHHDLAQKVALDAAVWGVTLWASGAIVAQWGSRFGLAGITDLAALPLLAVLTGAGWGLVRPLRLAQSRTHERRADRFALEHTGNAEALGRALRRLGAEHLAEERPSRLTHWFFHRHPTLEERLAMAQRVTARRR
jgi:STE24 endopeptidase